MTPRASQPAKHLRDFGDVAESFSLFGGDVQIKKVETTVGSDRSWAHNENRHFILAHAAGRMRGLVTSIGGTEQRCAPPIRGHLWIVPAGAGYVSHASGDRIGYCATYIAPGLVARLRPAASAHSELASATAHRDEYMFQLIMRLSALVAEPDDLSRMAAETAALALCQHLARDYSGAATLPVRRPKALGGPVAKRLEDFIATHIAEPIRLDRLAQLAGLPTHKFLPAFRATFDTTPAQYVIRQRLSLAAWLLESTTDEISSVALSCGFSSHSHLTTAFAAAFGMPPSRYRQMRQR